MQETLLNIRKVGYSDDDPEADIVFTETQGQSWTIAGVYPFTVPPNVFFLCGVAIGGGGPSYSKGPEGGNWGTGGAGGGLGWKNAIPVTPGETLIVEVGAAGKNFNTGDEPPSGVGGRSCLRRGTTVLFSGLGGTGGQTGTASGVGGSYTGDGGGNGGSGVGFNYYTAGGGGAGGYTGAGGNGGFATNGTVSATAGAGGGGGGGGGDNGALARGGRGGGTGLFGQGNNGAVATGPNKPGGHGSYSFGTGAFGGGGTLGCLGPNSAVKARQGAVRVIWAVGSQVRAFPSNNVGRI